MKKAALLLFLVAACPVFGAEFRLLDIPENELIGGSDLIAVGTVTRMGEVTNAPAFMRGQARIRIERVIKGEATGTVTVAYAARTAAGAHSADFVPDQRRLYFMRKTCGGYTLTVGYEHVRAESEADEFARRVAAFPISVSLVPPVGPFPPGQSVRLTAVIRNRSAVEIPGYSARAESYFLRPGDYDDTVRPPLQTAPVAAAPRPQPIAPGAERTVTLDVVGQWPSTLAMIALDPKLSVPMAARVVVYVEAEAPGKSKDMMLRAISIASPWTNGVIGQTP